MELRHVAYSHMLSRAAISYAFLPVWAQQQQQAFSDPLCSKDLEFRDGPLGFTLEGSLVVAVETNSQAGQGEDVGKFLGKGDQWWPYHTFNPLALGLDRRKVHFYVVSGC